MSAPTLEAFREHVLTSVRQIGERLPPDGDWAPMMLLDTPEGLDIVPLVNLQTPYAEQNLIPGMIVVRRARLVAQVRPAWGLQGAEHLPGQLHGTEQRPREHAQRQDIVVVYVASPERLEAYLAKVERHADRPPALGDWEPQQAAMGPTTALLRAALARAAARR